MEIEASHTYYALYVAVHREHKKEPEVWKNGHCCRVLSTIMAGRPFSWPVVGITTAALTKFSEFNFLRKSKMGITRAHIEPRSKTASILFGESEPFNESEFLNIWMKNDKTVFCVKGENKTVVPKHIKFENADGELFSSTSVAWRHERREQDFLRTLFEREIKGVQRG